MARLEVITGPMFCGKTEELTRRLARASIAEERILIVTPLIDNGRPNRNILDIIKENKNLRNYHLLKYSRIPDLHAFIDLIRTLKAFKPKILAIDEAQFFKSWLIDSISELLDINEDTDFRIIVAGLDTDYLTKPFGIMPSLLAMADDVQKIPAICTKCKRSANLTYRKPGNSDEQILVGDKDIYEARCRKCHKLPS